MMTADAIYQRARVRPFRPYRLTTRDGEHYDVFHVGLILVSKDRVTVGVYGPDDDREQLPNLEVYFSPHEVVGIEDLRTTH